MKHLLIITSFFFLYACSEKKEVIVQRKNKPIVTELGKIIKFPNDTIGVSHFGSYIMKNEKLSLALTAPARIVASVVRNINKNSYNILLFNDPDLTGNFSIYLERLVNIKTYKINLGRVKDLYNNGAATGREVTEAQTLLNNEEAAIIENEAKFLLAGLEPDDLLTHDPGTVWLICDLPENDIYKLKLGEFCKINVKAYPNDKFKGQIEDFGDVVDNVTRMVKLRIEAHNPEGKMKAGMFTTIEFGVTEGEFLCVPGNSVITVQGKDYVFIHKNKFEFERKEILTGQQIDDKIVVYNGLEPGDTVITEGVMQLKGLSFGY